MNKYYRFIGGTLLGLVLTACGGGGGGSSNNDQTDSQGSAGDGSVVNTGLSGQFFFVYQDAAYVKDVQTGVNTKIPNTDWEDQNNRFPSGVAAFYATASSYDQAEFVVEVDRCQRSGPDPLDPYETCIAIQDYNGNYTGGFNLLYSLSSSVRLSRDRQYVAMVRDLDDPWLAIYTRDGTFISNSQVETSSFAWLPDGRLIYAQDRRVLFTDPYSTVAVTQLTLPATMPTGVIGWLAVSPDGSRIAFSIIQESNFAVTHAIPFVMNTDGSNIRQLAREPNEPSPNIGPVTWSPDGQWMFLRAGGADGQDPNAPGVLGYGYVIPANEDRALVLSPIDSERSPAVIKLRHYLIGSAAETLTDRFSSTGYSWQP